MAIVSNTRSISNNVKHIKAATSAFDLISLREDPTSLRSHGCEPTSQDSNNYGKVKSEVMLAHLGIGRLEDLIDRSSRNRACG